MTISDACFNRIAIQLPGEVRFLVALRVAGQPEDFAEDAPRSMSARLLGPVDMAEIWTLDFEIDPISEVSADHPAGWEVAQTVPVIVNCPVEEEGPYTLNFYIGSELQAGPGRSVAFWVAEAQPSA